MSDKIEPIRLCGVLQRNFCVLANQIRGDSCVMVECKIDADPQMRWNPKRDSPKTEQSRNPVNILSGEGDWVCIKQ